MNRLLCLLVMCLPLMIMAQTDSVNASTQPVRTKEGLSMTEGKGIHWTTGLSWEQVKEKAKDENKYIFVDAYATWCGPCKLMDKNVYTSDSVGEIVNEKFIAVKVQMDKTAKDNEQVKLWYKDADSIKNQYHIEGYPTLLFFNPEGQVTEKQLGFKPLGEFINIVKTATVPGKLYDDPYVVYRLRLSNYQHGMKEYDQYPSMIIMADKLHDTTLSKQLRKELIDYVAGLPPKERYTKERIEFWNNYTWGSNTRVFVFFYKDASLINKVMNKKGYAESIVDKTIQYDIALPFMREQAKGSGIAMEGMYLTYMGPGPGPKTDTSEADWKKLHKMICSKYGKDCAERNVLIAKIEWYTRHRNTAAIIRYTLEQLNHYPPDLSEWGTMINVNGQAWSAFLKSTDRKILKGYADWMKRLIEKQPDYGECADTYANLLYKLGNKKQAIEWEEKAVKLSPKDPAVAAALQKMKNGEPTYIDQGAIWD